MTEVGIMDSYERNSAALTIRHGASHLELANRSTPFLATPSSRQRAQSPVPYAIDRRDAKERHIVVDRLPTAEEIEFHASLCERIARLRRERPGFWSVLRQWVRSMRVN
jgi:hypothetical protein